MNARTSAGLRRGGLLALAASLGCGPVRVPAARHDAPVETLAFERAEGDVHNYFFRRGPVAAHVLLRSSTSPRIVVAFPAGNAGAGLWFDAAPSAVALTLEGALVPVDGAMRGVAAVVRLGASSLRLRAATLGSLRFVREQAVDGRASHGTARVTSGAHDAVELARTLLDGRHVSVRLEPLDGATLAIEASGAVTAARRPGADAIRLRITTLCDEPALTPIESDALLTAPADDLDALHALAFLSYREKLLAGSWRFLTYFGRDTLLSIRLLMPVLRPEVIEAGLGAVIDRLAADGDVAHEEDVGEFAAWDASQSTGGAADPAAPGLDYKMVDDDLLLAPIVAHYLLDTAIGATRAAAFLARRTPRGVTYAAALGTNLQRVLRLARPFAATRDATSLVAIRDGISVGEWRDSQDGLGGGRIPFDVNVALVPAALEATQRLCASALVGVADRDQGLEAQRLAAAWAHVGALFRVVVPEAAALERVRAYGLEQRLDVAPALASIHGDVAFPALALDAAGRGIDVMHSDDGFVLLFAQPASDELLETATRITRPFPAGLLTPVGIVVADPAYSPDAALRGRFTRAAYHGTVVWSWQQAMLAAGLARQLERADVTRPAREALLVAQAALWRAIEATRTMRGSELWSFAFDDGGYRVAPFGQSHRDADEANAAQLWSTVYLAVRPPRGLLDAR